MISLIFFFAALQGSVGEIRINYEHFSLKNEKKLRAASLKQNLLVLMKKRVYFEEHLWMSASKLYFKRDYNTGVFLWTLLFTNTYFVVDLRTAGSETPVRGSLFNKVASVTAWRHLTLSWRRPLSYRNRANQCRANQWTGFHMISAPFTKELTVLLCKSMEWFLYDISPHHERVNSIKKRP